ncbi:MAG: riboflavin synthase [Chloroflexi bacterium]|nr:riboflavin synthase [Chloroflexota bacterium]MCL5075168.1 riboflavin synthase [Chloroflexota bacterium]
MFTGIVEEVGKVREVRADRLTIKARLVLTDLKPGDSIAVNGACLTVARRGEDWFAVAVMPETIKRTNLSQLVSGDRVNLERALPLGGRLGGHFVQGHIDDVGRVLTLRREKEAIVMRFAAPPEVMRYIVEKGFIAVDGVSLTVTACDDAFFDVSLVKYTRENTNLGEKRSGDLVNLEVDILAKYIEKFTQERTSKASITAELLATYDYKP